MKLLSIKKKLGLCQHLCHDKGCGEIKLTDFGNFQRLQSGFAENRDSVGATCENEQVKEAMEKEVEQQEKPTFHGQ